MLTPIQDVGRATPLKRTQNHRRAQTLEFVRIKCNELCVYLVQFMLAVQPKLPFPLLRVSRTWKGGSRWRQEWGAGSLKQVVQWVRCLKDASSPGRSLVTCSRVTATGR